MNNFPTQIKQARQSHDLNRADFAELIGVANGTVGMWESGANPPSLQTAVRCAMQKDLPQWVRSLFVELLDGHYNVSVVAVAEPASGGAASSECE